MSFAVYVDGSANLPGNMLDGISLLPCEYTVNGKPQVYMGDVDHFDGHAYYEGLRNGQKINTSLLNTQTFLNEFTPLLKSGQDIIYVSMSSGISGTYNSARVAATALEEDESIHNKVYLIDSLNASLAQGILAIYASEMRANGRDIVDIYNELSTYPPHMNGVFTVGNLKHLVHTGRISNTKAVIGNMLNIKPILRGNKDGFIVEFKKCRGRKAVLNELIDLVVH